MSRVILEHIYKKDFDPVELGRFLEEMNENNISAMEGVALYCYKNKDYESAELCFKEACHFSTNDNIQLMLDKLEKRKHIIKKGPFYKKCFVITGALESFTREDALKTIYSYGGKIADTPVNSMNYLIVGYQEWSEYNNGLASRKIVKADELQKKGKNVKIISEEDFLELVEPLMDEIDRAMGLKG